MVSAKPKGEQRFLVLAASLGAVIGVALIMVTAANFALGWNVLPPSLLVIGAVLTIAAAATLRQVRR